MFERWGVTDAETAARYGCDDLVPDPRIALWRGVDVDAPVETVWAWVRMLRLAPYSYDWVDNLGRRSPRELRELPEPAVGDRGVGAGRVVAVEPGVEVTYRVLSSVISYQVAPGRLLMKLVVPQGIGATLLRPVLPAGDLVMARRQLTRLAALARSSADGQSRRRSSLA